VADLLLAWSCVATTERSADLIFLLQQAVHSLESEMTHRLAAVGVTPRSYCVLYHALAGEFTQIQLAEQCALDKTTMVVTLDGLERAGLAERRPSPTDRRARIVAVTEAGAGRLRRVAGVTRGGPPREAAGAGPAATIQLEIVYF
jgi:MarR family transcriptional regulator for hemolysin